MRRRYTTVKIPYELAEKLDEFSAGMGYLSRAEVVNDAIRRFIDEREQSKRHAQGYEKLEEHPLTE